MDDAFKKAFNKIIDELVEKGRAEVEIRGILSEHNGQIHNIELILKDKADEDELNSLKERVLLVEQELKQKNKNKTALITLIGTIGAAAIYGIVELVKYLINK